MVIINAIKLGFRRVINLSSLHTGRRIIWLPISINGGPTTLNGFACFKLSIRRKNPGRNAGWIVPTSATRNVDHALPFQSKWCAEVESDDASPCHDRLYKSYLHAALSKHSSLISQRYVMNRLSLFAVCCVFLASMDKILRLLLTVFFLPLNWID